MRFQYKTRTILLVTAVVAAWLGFRVHVARQQQAVVAVLREHGAEVLYDYQVDEDERQDLKAKPFGPQWFSELVGVDLFNTPVKVATRQDSRFSDADFELVGRLLSLRMLYSSSELITDQGLVHLKGLARLETLELDASKVTDNGLALLLPCQNLKTLYLADTGIGDAGVRRLAGLPRLENLTVCNTKVSDQIVDIVLRDLPKLTYLDLRWTEVSEEAIHRLEGARPNLTVLY